MTTSFLRDDGADSADPDTPSSSTNDREEERREETNDNSTSSTTSDGPLMDDILLPSDDDDDDDAKEDTDYDSLQSSHEQDTAFLVLAEDNSDVMMDVDLETGKESAMVDGVNSQQPMSEGLPVIVESPTMDSSATDEAVSTTATSHQGTAMASDVAVVSPGKVDRGGKAVMVVKQNEQQPVALALVMKEFQDDALGLLVDPDSGMRAMMDEVNQQVMAQLSPETRAMVVATLSVLWTEYPSAVITRSQEMLSCAIVDGNQFLSVVSNDTAPLVRDFTDEEFGLAAFWNDMAEQVTTFVLYSDVATQEYWTNVVTQFLNELPESGGMKESVLQFHRDMTTYDDEIGMSACVTSWKELIGGALCSSTTTS